MAGLLGTPQWGSTIGFWVETVYSISVLSQLFRSVLLHSCCVPRATWALTQQ